MTRFFNSVLTVGILALALESSTAMAQPAAADSINPPAVPTNLQVPLGNTVFMKGAAKGTQNYICLPTANGFAWTFFSPQATLSFTFKMGSQDVQQQIVTHFLSPNPAEGGTPRVTWQSSLDTSAVRAKAIQSSTDPSFVASGAIPWVLLEQVGVERGPTGGDILSNTAFVQRLNTAGGVVPANGCNQASNVGAMALVPYTADYFFYKASSPQN